MSDPRPLTALLLDNPGGVCAECIMLKAGIELGELRTTFQRLAKLLRIVARHGDCAACSRPTMVFALARSPFILGDLVGSHVHPEWVGEVVGTSRFRSGYVTVRWRTPPGTSLASVEEPSEALFRLPPLKGGATVAWSPAAMLALHRAALATRVASADLHTRSHGLRVLAQRLRLMAADARALTGFQIRRTA